MLLPPDLRAVEAETELDQRNDIGRPQPSHADAFWPTLFQRAAEEKGGGDEVQATSADRMAELLDRMGRTNRRRHCVGLGTGIA